MSKAEEARREKARQMRYRRPACKSMRWDYIRQDLQDIAEEVGEGQWLYGQYEALNGAEATLDEEIVYELQIAFSDLAAECERMAENMDALRSIEDDLFYDDSEEYDDPPALFECFFPAIDYYDQLYGYDVEEHDYYGIEYSMEDFARRQARKRLKHLTKDKLIECAARCMEIARQYMSLRARYDGLSTALAVLRGQFEGRLEMVKHIERLYEDAEQDTRGFKYAYGRAIDRLDSALAQLPERLWIE